MLQEKNKSLERLMHIVGIVSKKIGTENLALAMMAICNLIWPTSFLYVSQHHFSPFQTNMARGVAICFSHLLICYSLGIDLNYKSWKDIKYLFIRNTLIGLHQYFYNGLHYVLSFPLLNSILITGPLFVFIIDYYLNGVTINRDQILGIVISFVGILININGELLMKIIDPSFQITTTYQNYQVTDIQGKIFYSILAILANVVWGYAIVAQKQIRHIPGIKISFFLGIQFLFSSGVASSMGVVRPVTLSEFVGACFFTGLVMAFCQIMFISALNLSKNAGKLTILMLLYTVSGYLISFFKFDEEINFICVMGLVMMGFGLYRTIFLATS